MSDKSNIQNGANKILIAIGIVALLVLSSSFADVHKRTEVIGLQVSQMAR